ncbi:MAG: geranylgeranylglyceryl/heptaprenylglyceryl phosphate synthase [Candidatus Aramenus sulfurataquae]|jgi:phosphoglycerol geranylgeranyltransferase|uniref:Geranylgeranylglyceryl phosphate synthase n=2 Tax=Candidatus Aramenus sulfurataquae TaxID=1326980 RepID=A0A0F2LV65_9CREN|nr:geranylgeranylglyceryl/heptaprenylglyceryl phosphate synthase [Candidatus Aramenus sulfurataquae]
MKLKGKVRNYIKSLIDEGRVLHFSLIDPDKVDDLSSLYDVSKELYEHGTSAFLVGGTLGVSSSKLDAILDLLDDFPIPKIIFPSNINLISQKADAIFFMSLLNSDDLYYVVGAQVAAAPLIKKLELETLPTAYLIVGHGGTAAHVGRARVIPYDNVDLAVAYSLAAQYMGMEFVYLEAGSGAPETVRPEMVQIVKRFSSVNVIVGGGIRSPERALELARAGANIIVTGNVIERDPHRAISIIESLGKVKVRE